LSHTDLYDKMKAGRRFHSSILHCISVWVFIQICSDSQLCSFSSLEAFKEYSWLFSTSYPSGLGYSLRTNFSSHPR
jgi:hypothetical protein